MRPRICRKRLLVKYRSANCRVKYRGRQVESGVKYVKRNALAGRRFPSWAALNTWLEEWASTVADQRVHGTTHERLSVRFAQEQLTPLGVRPPYL